MKVAIIAPTSLLRPLQERFNLKLHLCLAQVCYENPDYLNFYAGLNRDEVELILDNGAAELGAAVEFDRLFNMAMHLRPTVVVAPDVIGDADATIQRTQLFLDRFGSLLARKGIKVMAVPQGKTMEDYLRCFDVFNNDPRIDWLGVTMFCDLYLTGGRYAALLWLQDRGVKKPCHLLGIWSNPYSLRWEKRFSFVRSNDTSKPVSLALQGLQLWEWSKREERKDDYFNREVPAASLQLVFTNVRRFLRIARLP